MSQQATVKITQPRPADWAVRKAAAMHEALATAADRKARTKADRLAARAQRKARIAA